MSEIWYTDEQPDKRWLNRVSTHYANEVSPEFWEQNKKLPQGMISGLSERPCHWQRLLRHQVLRKGLGRGFLYGRYETPHEG